LGQPHQEPITNLWDVTFQKNGDPMFVVVDLQTVFYDKKNINRY